MTLPIPPSDNLYKFLAISGLICVALSTYLPLKMYSDLKAVIFDVELEFDKAELEASYQEKDADLIHAEILRLQEGGKSTPDSIEQLRIKNEQLLSKNRQSLLASQEIHHATKKMSALNSQTGALLWISCGTVVIGFLMTVSGFWLWYNKSQVHQDRIIRAQAEQWTKPRTTEREKEEIPG